MGKITNLLHEFQDLFSTKFSEMKGIVGDVGEMKIPLKPDERHVKKQPYRLNLRYKEKVNVEFDPMLDARIIKPVEELECIRTIVVQDKKNCKAYTCVDLRKLNDSFLHDMFPTPFIDEVLENIGGKEVLFYGWIFWVPSNQYCKRGLT